MLPKSEKLCLDILTAIDEIQDFLAEASLASFTQSRLQQVAIERELEIIGEALNRLERADASLFDQIENGRKIIGMRNVLAHGYDVIDYRILWSTARCDVEPLKNQIQALLNK
jgi:uncharacterized protein with HEPN domain